MGHCRKAQNCVKEISGRNWSMGTGQVEAVGEKKREIKVRNAGEESVLIYRTFKLLGGVFWFLIL